MEDGLCDAAPEPVAKAGSIQKLDDTEVVPPISSPAWLHFYLAKLAGFFLKLDRTQI